MLDIRKWQILSSTKVLKAGTKRPLLTTMGLFGDEHSPLISEFALKPVGPSMGVGQVCAEILATMLAHRMGLKSVSGTIVVLADKEAELISRPGRAVPRGPAFASNFMHDSATFKGESELHPIDAWKIYLFDYIIQNRDRTSYKPNLLTNRDGLYPIDHEQALDFCWKGNAPDTAAFLMTSTAMDAHVLKNIAQLQVRKDPVKGVEVALRKLLSNVKPSDIDNVELYCKPWCENNFNWNQARSHIENIKQTVQEHALVISKHLQ